jgi:thioesterase domain-containing protein
MSKMQEMMGLIPTLERMNCKVLEETPNRCVIEMPLEGNTNHLGTVYAGALMSLAEFPFGMMYLSRFDIKTMYPIVGDMSVRFTAPAMTPVKLAVEVTDEQWQQIEAETLAQGKSKFVLPLELLDENDQVVAKTEAIYFSIKA